ncbi:MAG: hypothetical protein ACI4MY_03895 [Christensenellales bacterium]
MINKDTYKRLTNKNLEEFNPKYDFCIGCKDYDKYNGCNRQSGSCANYEDFNEVYNRLAELEDKIENGTLLELPCKVGDTVYHTDNVGDEIYEGKIKKIIYDLGYMAFDETAIGTGIFLTKETVEAKCKEIKNE